MFQGITDFIPKFPIGGLEDTFSAPAWSCKSQCKPLKSFPLGFKVIPDFSILSCSCRPSPFLILQSIKNQYFLVWNILKKQEGMD